MTWTVFDMNGKRIAVLEHREDGSFHADIVDPTADWFHEVLERRFEVFDPIDGFRRYSLRDGPRQCHLTLIQLKSLIGLDFETDYRFEIESDPDVVY